MSVYRLTPEQMRAHQQRMQRLGATGAAGPIPAGAHGQAAREKPPGAGPYDPVPHGMTGEGRSPAFLESFGKAKDVVAEYMDGKRERKFVLRLPWPPTLNGNTLPTASGGRVLTPDHRTFRQEVAYAVYNGKLPRLYGRLRVYIRANPPDNRPRDLDNIVKPTLDALQRVGAIENDRNVDDLHIVRSTVIPRGTIDVEVGEL